MKAYLSILMALIALVPGCRQKSELPHMTEANLYHDHRYGYTISYPKDWSISTSDNQAVFTSREKGDQRSELGEPGATVTISALDSTGTAFPDVVREEKEKMIVMRYEVDAGGRRTDDIYTKDGTQQAMVSYVMNPSPTQKVYAHMVLIRRGSIIYRLNFSGHDKQYFRHLTIFEEMLNSFHP